MESLDNTFYQCQGVRTWARKFSCDKEDLHFVNNDVKVKVHYIYYVNNVHDDVHKVCDNYIHFVNDVHGGDIHDIPAAHDDYVHEIHDKDVTDVHNNNFYDVMVSQDFDVLDGNDDDARSWSKTRTMRWSED